MKITTVPSQRVFTVEISEYELSIVRAGLIQLGCHKDYEQDRLRLIRVLDSIQPELASLF